MSFSVRVVACLGVLVAAHAHAADDQAEKPSPGPRYETVVVGTTPLHGSMLPADRVPANVQTAGAEAIDGSRGLDLVDFMNGALASVTVSQVQESPLQPDLQYRGFTASPVLGSAQGMSVFLDGVRLNEPFGDVVSWDLVPPGAIRSLNLMPGSNPLFGLNTLGGSLSLETKTGFDAPGARASLSGGSWGRRLVLLEAGGHGEHWGAFAAARAFTEDGWRQDSPSHALDGFVSTTYQSDGTMLDLAVMAAGDVAAGLGAAPVELLAQDRSATFTHPDQTQNRMLMAILRGERRLAPTAYLSADVYLRTTRTLTRNGDQAEWDRCPSADQAGFVCAQGGTAAVLDASGSPVPYDPGQPYDAADHTTSTRQLGIGGSVQGRFETRLGGRENHLFVGASVDRGLVRFGSQTRLGRLDDARGVIDGAGIDPGSRVDVDGAVANLGLFASDTFAALPALFVTVSSRLGVAVQSLEDRLGGDLGGQHRYARVDPAAGVSYQPRAEIGGYLSYSESARAPTPVELTCASPSSPCRLPGAFVADPPLAQVVARTLEAGVRGRVEGARAVANYAVSVFRTAASDDILFVSAGPATNQGYFADVGDTRRQGIEVMLAGRVRLGPRAGRLDWVASYTHLDATFRSPFVAPSPNHPLATSGQIDVAAGARLPSTPDDVGKASLIWGAPFGLALGATILANGSQFYRGDEANALAPIPGYVLVNLRADYDVVRWATAFVRVDNVLDARYASFGVLGNATAVLPSFGDPRFQSPGAPRAAWAGVELRY